MNSNFLEPPQPKFDIKKNLIMTAIIFAGIMIYMNYFGQKPAEETPVAQPQITQTAPATAIATTDSHLNNDSTRIATVQDLSKFINAPCITIKDSDVSVAVNPYTGTLDSVLLLNYLTAETYQPIPMFAHFMGKGAFAPTSTLWAMGVQKQVQHRGNEVIFSYENGNFKTVETYTLDSGFQIRYQVQITNISEHARAVPPITLSTGPLESEIYLSNDQAYGSLHTIAGLSIDGAIKQENADASDEDLKNVFNVAKSYTWLAVQNKYCATILKSNDPLMQAEAICFYVDAPNAVNVKYPVLTATGKWVFNAPLSPNESITRTATLYAGPKLLEPLGKFDSKFVEAMKLSYFSWFEFLARFVLQIMLWIHANIIASYGIAIILVTLVIKGIFWPLQTKSIVSMRKMQAIQPKMKEIQEKYKDNKALLNEKIMELYRTEGVNPVSGCLPLLIQMPIFIALFAALNGAVELRQVPFLWIADLSKPDAIAVIFGLPIHPLVIAQTLLMVLQQKMSPSSAEGPQKMMMYLMPIMLLVFFYNMPAGLTLYMTVSSIPQIIQQWFMLKAHKQNLTTTDTSNIKSN